MTSLFRRPEILSAVHVHAPVALSGGKTPLHIVARGKGWLRVTSDASSSPRRFCADGFDGVVHVDVAGYLRVEFSSLVGRAVVVVAIPHIVRAGPHPSPAPALDVARLSPAPSHHVPDLRPPALTPCIPGAK